MEPPVMLDVSHLPPTAFDTRAPVWWGNTWFMVIETTTIVLLVVSYYYAWQSNLDWPPPRADAGPAASDPRPSLGIATLNALLLVASCLPMVWVDRAARRQEASTVRRGLVLLAAIGGLAIALRIYEFPALKFRWDDNAYGSLVWAILGMHLTYLVAAALEVLVLAFWIFRYGMDEKQAVDVTLTALYWYWMAGLWVPLYATVYWAPRLL